MTLPAHVIRIIHRKRETFSSMMLAALRRGERFTGPEAYERWGVWSVSSLIHGLRMKGWQVDSDLVSTPQGTKRAQYSMTRKRDVRSVSLSEARSSVL